MSKTLITVQYVFSIILIITVLVITKQTDFALNKGIGVKDNNVICLDFVHQNIQKKFELFNLKFLCRNTFSETNDENEGSGEYIINESAMKRLGHNKPSQITGKDFRILSAVPGVQLPGGKIIAVVEDFHLSTLPIKLN